MPAKAELVGIGGISNTTANINSNVKNDAIPGKIPLPPPVRGPLPKVPLPKVAPPRSNQKLSSSKSNQKIPIRSIPSSNANTSVSGSGEEEDLSFIGRLSTPAQPPSANKSSTLPSLSSSSSSYKSTSYKVVEDDQENDDPVKLRKYLGDSSGVGLLQSTQSKLPSFTTLILLFIAFLIITVIVIIFTVDTKQTWTAFTTPSPADDSLTQMIPTVNTDLASLPTGTTGPSRRLRMRMRAR